jgi:cell division protein FtsI (penicillin-binding protein 3)/stage V sporulation protein D (sporulation-specific penicillin-binding protein)
MLVDVVENGHGKKAAVKGFYIAGKTGTAQVPLVGRSGYDPNKNIGSFIGFGPVDNPQFVMLVRVDGPKDVKFAETTAAPAFGEIAGFILNYLQVPPSRQ